MKSKKTNIRKNFREVKHNRAIYALKNNKEEITSKCFCTLEWHKKVTNNTNEIYIKSLV